MMVRPPFYYTFVAPLARLPFRTAWLFWTVGQVLANVFDALDVKLSQESVIIDGDSVAQVVSIDGHDVGRFLGLPPTGKAFHVRGVFLYDLKDGRIARERRIYDFTAMLVQIGLLKTKPAD
jgi:ketosteroid isomerase-like protein